MQRLHATLRGARPMLNELGHNPAPDHLDWHLVARFTASSVRDAVNGTAFCQEINRRAAMVNPPVGHILVLDPSGQPLEALVFVHPDVSITLVDRLLTAIEDGELLDEDAYWRKMDPLIQTVWAKASTSERIDYVARGGIDAHSAILNTEVPEGAHNEIWRQLDD